MRRPIFAAFAAAVLLAACAGAPRPAFEASPEAVQAHMTFLADDLMEGRESGTRGYDLAATYVATRFLELGLKPAGDAGTWFQRTEVVRYMAADRGELAVAGAGGRTPLSFGVDYLPSANPLQADLRLDAPLAFVGYGISAPERGRDDYAGLDVRGKIVVVLGGAPRSFPSEERAHHGHPNTKRLEAERRGAVGVITLLSASQEASLSMERRAGNWQSKSTVWMSASGQPWFRAPRALPIATVGRAGAEKLFGPDAGRLDEIMAATATDEGLVPGFALSTRLQARLASRNETFTSANVVAVLPGSDPKLADEFVVLSAHLDHVGIRGDGEDRINNGAMDNASGVATMLEAARGLKADSPGPRRSVLFLAVTAEEMGLVGSDRFAVEPTVPKSGIVANVNLDMPILTHDFVDVVAFGADRSSIGPAVRRAAERVGVALSPDPFPEQGWFTRSDHYRFVEQGVPAVFLATGHGGDGKEAFDAFMGQNYHRPGDDLSQPINYEAGARFARLNYEIARELANADEPPAWNAGDFFGTLFGGRTAPAR